MANVLLLFAIVAEVVATTALKMSDEFTQVVPSIVVVLGYGIAFYLLSLVLKSMPVGVAYAIWSGVGVALITVIGAVFFKQSLDTPAILGIVLIVAGVVLINVVSSSSNA